ncbi:diguanylate cyclase [Rhodococcus ruber]|uniref:Diguanylate cyclase n=1 Tax=Rhodococcus ruber TaxID=1830 RepID=A0ABT4MA84_9NOCA|nr:diguanylate cyclase [Rhodococcus ruber]MCZ4517875.1 diguanylate cyclase [Rhodococcus ruber]
MSIRPEWTTNIYGNKTRAKSFVSGYRRILFPLLAVLFVFYASSTFVAVVFDSYSLSASGDVIAMCASAAGVFALSVRRVRVWQHSFALGCAVGAPLSAALFHEHLVALLWTLIPLMFIAMYVRGVCSVAFTARLVCATIALSAVLVLALSPANPPVLWYFLWAACIFASAEIYGSLVASLLFGVLRDPLTSVWNRTGAVAAAAELIDRAQERDEQITAIVIELEHAGTGDEQVTSDRALRRLTEVWSAALPSSAVLARISRGEFVAVLRGIGADAEHLAAELAGRSSTPIGYGIATGPPVPDTFAQLLLDADGDLYRRKRLAARRFGSNR